MTLTTVATITRRFILFSVIFSILAVIGFISYRIWHTNYLRSLPPVEEKPDTKFGVLPDPDFPLPKVSSSNFSYSIDTQTGNLPEFGGDIAKIQRVYFMPKPFATLLSPERSTELAQMFGFGSPPEILSELEYRYSDEEKELIVNLDTGNFKYNKFEHKIVEKALILTEEEVNQLKKLLENLGVMKGELKTGRGRILADFVITLWPSDIDSKPIVTPNFKRSLVYASLSTQPADKIENFIQINFTFWPVDITSFATYPVKTPEEALNDLKNGKGIVIVEPSTPRASISDIYLAYYQSEIYTPYLQPIYVFEGPEFVGFIAAIAR